TPMAYSESSAAAASSPECTASARMPRLDVARPTTILAAVSPSAASSEINAVRRAVDTGPILGEGVSNRSLAHYHGSPNEREPGSREVRRAGHGTGARPDRGRSRGGS